MAAEHILERHQIERKRTGDYQFSLYQSDGTTAGQLSAGDVVRFKLYDTNTLALLLDLDSVAATSNGSVVTIDGLGDATTPATATVRFAQDDMTMPTGIYEGELGYVDDSETAPVDAFKCIARIEIEVVGSAAGDVAKT